jgi:nucleotide-binding universal stress UspA family protein
MAILVVGYDGTEGARAALSAAAELAEELGDAVVAVFAYSIGRLGGEVADYAKAVEEHGATVLEEAGRIGADAGVELDAVMREREAAEGLIEVADEHDARMIVVGSHGERPLKSALIGSTPTRLLHLSERPVLVVRAHD